MFLILRIEYFESLESNAELTLRIFFGTLNVNSGLTEPIFFGHRTIAGTACGIVDDAFSGDPDADMAVYALAKIPASRARSGWSMRGCVAGRSGRPCHPSGTSRPKEDGTRA